MHRTVPVDNEQEHSTLTNRWQEQHYGSRPIHVSDMHREIPHDITGIGCRWQGK